VAGIDAVLYPKMATAANGDIVTVGGSFGGTSATTIAVAGSATALLVASDSGTGVGGTGGQYGGYFAGGSAQLYLFPGGTPGAPTSGSHHQGEVYVDDSGLFYTCKIAGTPGTWMQLSTTDLGLHSFSRPHRVYKNLTAVSGQTYSGITALTDIHGSATGVPTGAASAYCAVQSYQDGTLTLFPDAGTDPLIANYSVSGNGSILRMLYVLVPLSVTGKFSIHSYLTGDIYVDVWGYLT
jgi:hypothetical protein